MLGSAGGGGGAIGGGGAQHTGAAIRGLGGRDQTSTTRALRGAEERSDAVALDSVSREEARSMMVELLEEERRGAKEELEQPYGHAISSVHERGEAFPSDPYGRPMPPSFADVQQGNLNDAWLLAACAAVAHAEPNALVERVKKIRPGEFEVRLRNQTFTITSQFSREGYANPRPNGRSDLLWVALIEKAFAMWHGGSYAKMEHGNPGRALEALTDRRSIRRSILPSISPATLASWIPAKHQPAVAVTHGEEALSRADRTASGLLADHAYAVVGVAGTRVRLYNPWGAKSGSRSVEEAIATVELDLFRRAVASLYVTGGR